MSNDLPATRQAIEAQNRSLPGKVTGKLRKAIDLMVWEGANRKEAALASGLTDHGLRQAFRRPHVLAFYRAECEVLRTSGRAKRLHRLDELAMQDENRNAAVAAIKVAEGLPEEGRMGGGSQFAPGLVIVINNQPSPVARAEPLTITVDPEPDPVDPTRFKHPGEHIAPSRR